IVATLDTSRPGLDWQATNVVGRPINREKISRLLRLSADTRLIEVSSRSAALGPSSVRRRAAFAPSLVDTPPSLDEFQFVASSLTAIDPVGARLVRENDGSDAFSTRSVGFGLGRVTDASKRRKLDEWVEWVNRLIASASDATRRPPSYLDRFAK